MQTVFRWYPTSTVMVFGNACCLSDTLMVWWGWCMVERGSARKQISAQRKLGKLVGSHLHIEALP